MIVHIRNCLYYISNATAFFVVDCCQFGSSWIFGLKIGAYDLCRLGWSYKGAKLSFSWPYMIVSIIWNNSVNVSITPQPCYSHYCCWLLTIWPKLDFWAESGAYGLCQLGWRYNWAKLIFSWPYIKVSMIWNTSENSTLHLSRVTAILLLIAANLAQAGVLGWKWSLWPVPAWLVL